MIRRMAAAIGGWLEESAAVEAKDAEVVRFGIAQMLYKALHLTTTVCIGLMIRRPLQALAFAAAFSPIRSYAGGIHADSTTGCYAMSSITSLVFLLVVRYTPRRWKPLLALLSLPLSLAAIWRLAPVENANHRLDQEERKVYRNRSRWIGAGLAIGAVGLTAAGLAEWSFVAAGSLLVAAIAAAAGAVKNRK